MKILLADWASRHYSPAPSLWTLRKMVRAGLIYPPPEKIGSAYYIEDTAQYLATDRPTVVQRMKAA